MAWFPVHTYFCYTSVIHVDILLKPRVQRWPLQSLLSKKILDHQIFVSGLWMIINDFPSPTQKIGIYDWDFLDIERKGWCSLLSWASQLRIASRCVYSSSLDRRSILGGGETLLASATAEHHSVSHPRIPPKACTQIHQLGWPSEYSTLGNGFFLAKWAAPKENCAAKA
jgi:hypothetical protein